MLASLPDTALMSLCGAKARGRLLLRGFWAAGEPWPLLPSWPVPQSHSGVPRSACGIFCMNSLRSSPSFQDKVDPPRQESQAHHNQVPVVWGTSPAVMPATPNLYPVLSGAEPRAGAACDSCSHLCEAPHARPSSGRPLATSPVAQRSTGPPASMGHCVSPTGTQVWTCLWVSPPGPAQLRQGRCSLPLLIPLGTQL